MIECHNCQNEVLVGALFCSECGSQIVFENGVPTSVIEHHPVSSPEKGEAISDQHPKAPAKPWPSPPQVGGVSLNVVSSGEFIELYERKEFTLGRVSRGQPIVPDIDLSPYQAYEAGVSRMHATIKIDQDQVTIIDLGSANGTRLNGKMISSQTLHSLKHGDILTLGKLKIQVLFRAKGSGG